MPSKLTVKQQVIHRLQMPFTHLAPILQDLSPLVKVDLFPFFEFILACDVLRDRRTIDGFATLPHGLYTWPCIIGN